MGKPKSAATTATAATTTDAGNGRKNNKKKVPATGGAVEKGAIAVAKKSAASGKALSLAAARAKIAGRRNGKGAAAAAADATTKKKKKRSQHVGRIGEDRVTNKTLRRWLILRGVRSQSGDEKKSAQVIKEGREARNVLRVLRCIIADTVIFLVDGCIEARHRVKNVNAKTVKNFARSTLGHAVYGADSGKAACLPEGYRPKPKNPPGTNPQPKQLAASQKRRSEAAKAAKAAAAAAAADASAEVSASS